jgi:hypothetical protein
MMNSNGLAVAFVAVAAALPISAPVAQTAQPSVAADAAASAPPDPPKKPSSRQNARERKGNADVRLCLEFPTNLMIHKCAEKYRPDKRET